MAEEQAILAFNRGGAVPAALLRLKTYYEVTGEEIARWLGTTRQTVNARMHGDSQCTPGDLAAFSEFFGVPVGVLFGPPDDALRWLLAHPDAADAAPAKAVRESRRNRRERRTADSRWVTPSDELVA